MALYFTTSTPTQLLQDIKAAIDKGKIVTWEYDSFGDFTHSPQQWKNKAWFRPQINLNQLGLGIINPGQPNLSIEIYGVYHGRFIEMMLAHFDKNFGSVKASALLVAPDEIR